MLHVYLFSLFYHHASASTTATTLRYEHPSHLSLFLFILGQSISSFGVYLHKFRVSPFSSVIFKDCLFLGKKKKKKTILFISWILK